MAHSDRTATLAGLFSGLCFGVFWVPIRLVEGAGFDPVWAMVIFTLFPALLCLPLIWRFRSDYQRGFTPLIGGILAGFAYALYTASLLYTEVVRAVLLFYLMPIWGFLLAWILMRDPMTKTRMLAILLGVTDMAVIFADDTGLPLPRNWGDWFGLISGMFWAMGCLLILNERRVSNAVHAISFFVVAALLSVIVAGLAVTQGTAFFPDWSNLPGVLRWLLPLSVILVLPAGFAAIYAPAHLNPGVVGLLFMTEVVVAAITSAIWAGEPLGWREAIGLPLVLLAGLAEPIADTFGRRGHRPT